MVKSQDVDGVEEEIQKIITTKRVRACPISPNQGSHIF